MVSRSGSADESPDDRRPSLDDLFVGEARFHEPTAAERAAAARRAEHDAKREARRRAREVEHTRRVLGGDDSERSYDRRTAAIGFGVMLALAVVLSVTPFAH